MLIGIAVVGCSGPTPEEERARWELDLRNWTESTEAGQFLLDVRVSGPPSTSLSTLTFRAVAKDQQENELAAEWLSIDLTEIPRGGPKDMIFRIPSVEGAYGIALDRMIVPTDEERGKITELAAAP